MTQWELDDVEQDTILKRSVLPYHFAVGELESSQPALILLTGQPGAGRARATGSLITDHGPAVAVVSSDDLRGFHPRFSQLVSSHAPDALEGVTRAAAGWMRDCIRYARENKCSLLLEGAFQDPVVALGAAQRFADAGFQTRIAIVASRRAESLLSVASLYLSNVRSGRLAVPVTREAHDRAFEATRALAAEAAGSASVDRLTVIGRNGDVVFDAHRADGNGALVGAGAALEAEQSTRLSRFDATQWLSELHHMSGFAMTRRDLPRGVTELLVELHEVSLREVIPELHAPRDGKFISIIEQKTAARLSELQRSMPHEQVVDLAAPVATPAGRERGDLSR